MKWLEGTECSEPWRVQLQTRNLPPSRRMRSAELINRSTCGNPTLLRFRA